MGHPLETRLEWLDWYEWFYCPFPSSVPLKWAINTTHLPRCVWRLNESTWSKCSALVTTVTVWAQSRVPHKLLKVVTHECVLRKVSVQTKNCPWKRQNDAVSWWVKWVQDSEGSRGTFTQRGEKARRKTDWRGCFWIAALELTLLSQVGQCAGASVSQWIHQQSRANGRLLSRLVLGNWF